MTTHLGYCGNVHPGETLEDVRAGLDVAHLVRERLGADRLAFGLWLSRSALAEVQRSGAGQLQSWLADRQLDVITVNGFPYGDFHAPVVKRRVYHPDWTTPERRAYTLELAEVVSTLAPDGRASISTLPIGHRGESDESVVEGAARALCALCTDLETLRERTEVHVRIGLEPEPGCWLETTGDAARFFSGPLARAARRVGLGEDRLRESLGLCFDTCHHAVAFEEPERALTGLAAAEIPVVKAQLSSAVELAEPASGHDALAAFDEPRFLHQTRCLRPSGAVEGVDDLGARDALPVDGPWRSHFHVPVHRSEIGGLTTTRPFLAEIAPMLVRLDDSPHLEVETYTWHVLPGESHGDLAEGLAAELAWAARLLEGESP